MNATDVNRTVPKMERRRQHNKVIVSVNSITAPDVLMEENDAIDVQSRMGHFGWVEANTDIYYGVPYILRDSKKYFAMQMILTKRQLRELLMCLDPDVYKYYNTVTVLATETESRLLNEINRRHCDGIFGKESFTRRSTLMEQSDAYALYEFLDTCYRKLTNGEKIESNKIGFIQFNFSGTYIPFVRRNDELYMPMYCFTNANNVRIEYMFAGWDLEYLRFCCLYQNIWRGSSDIFAVVSLSSLNDFLPQNTRLRTSWPPIPNHQLLRFLLQKPVVGNQQEGRNGSERGRNTIKMNQSVATAVEQPKMVQRNVQKRKSEVIEAGPPRKVQRRSKSIGMHKQLSSQQRQ